MPSAAVWAWVPVPALAALPSAAFTSLFTLAAAWVFSLLSIVAVTDMPPPVVMLARPLLAPPTVALTVLLSIISASATPRSRLLVAGLEAGIRPLSLVSSAVMPVLSLMMPT